MAQLTFEEKKKRVKEMLAENTALSNMIGMTQPNTAPTYDGDKMLEESRKSVGSRGRKYAKVAKDFASGKKFIRR